LRVKGFTDPKLYPGGRGKSRQQVFENNGCVGEEIFRHPHFLEYENNGGVGEEIFRHPHFLEYLWYFLYGTNLPASAIEEFRTALKDLGGRYQLKRCRPAGQDRAPDRPCSQASGPRSLR
jgi:hypothetical protein